MTPNPSADADQTDMIAMINSILLSVAAAPPSPEDSDQPDATDQVNNILLRAAYAQIPAKAAAAIPGLEIFEDSDNPGSWFWEWAWGECQDGPHDNPLEAMIAFAQFSSGLAVELGGDEEE